jgi:ABC-2 type transport system permease protein
MSAEPMSAATNDIAGINSSSPPGVRHSLPGRGLDFTALWALYVLTLRQFLHGKRWMVVGALFLLPAGLAILIRSTAHDVPSVALEFLLIFMFIPQAILPLVALLYASGMIQDEQEEQTITYLLIRPLPKWALCLVKLLAIITMAVLLTILFTIFAYLTIYVGAGSDVDDPMSRCLKAVAIHGLSVVAYCCLFGLLGLFTKRSLIVGILYIVVIEGLLANMPFGIRVFTVIYYSRLIAYRALSFVIPTPNGLQNMAADAWQLNTQQDPRLLEHPQFTTCIATLLIASGVCAILAALIFSRREYYVKTPENG